MTLDEAAAATAAADLVGRVRPLLDGTEAWVVGGAVRDAILGRPVNDLDLAVRTDSRAGEGAGSSEGAGSGESAAVAALTKAVARALGGAAFELSSEFPTWRALSRDGDWQVDIAALRGESIEEDLAERDFTLGAIAVNLETGEGVDPFEGIADLDAGLIKAVGPATFSSDPLRLMRAARLVSTFGWSVDEETLALGRQSAPQAAEPAGERIFDEFCQLLDGPGALRGVGTMDRLGLFDPGSLFPEIGDLRQVIQGPNHHLDVYGHTLEVLEGVIDIENDLERYVGDSAEATAELLGESLGGRATRSTGLRLAGLFHDIAKPATRSDTGGFVSFRGHDTVGIEMIDGIFGRLKAGRKVTRFVDDLTRHHLILGFMVPERPLDPRHEWFYLDHTDPVSVEVTLLTVADRLAARGNSSIASTEMVDGHLKLASEMVEAGIRWRKEGRPAPFIAGNELAAKIGIEPGPELGKVILELEAAQYAGEIQSADEAVEHARRFLQGQ